MFLALTRNFNPQGRHFKFRFHSPNYRRGSAESLLVYNTNTTTGKGFHYWNGSQWIAISSDDWKKEAMEAPSWYRCWTTFLGTSDAQDFIIATNGTGALPCAFPMEGYKPLWMVPLQTLIFLDRRSRQRFYSAGANAFGIATNGIERFTSSDAEAVFNDPKMQSTFG